MSNKPIRPPHFEKEERRRQLKKATKVAKRNRDDRPPRRRDWQGFVEGEEALDKSIFAERIMPRDERDRRQHVETLLQRRQDDGSSDDIQITSVNGHFGQVIEVSSSLCRVQVNNQTVICNLRGGLSAAESGFTNVIAVGDEVIINFHSPTQGIVEEVLPRRSVLARSTAAHNYNRQILVANVDQLLIVAAWRNPHIWTELIDRYLITAARDSIIPLICINKADLAENRDELEAIAHVYRKIGYEVIPTSATTGEGIDTLRDRLQGKSTVLTGLSGVGKSTLLTTIQPDFHLRTGEINEETTQGRHTTTQALMIPFGENGFVVDTPGIREWGLSGLTREELVSFYPEMTEIGKGCRFANCTHLHEPDCRIREAASSEQIAPFRYASYCKIRNALP